VFTVLRPPTPNSRRSWSDSTRAKRSRAWSVPPRTAGLLTESGWYYIRSEWQDRPPRAPVEVDRQVVAITFDDRGVVENVERFGLDRGEVVPLSRRVTTSNVKGIGFIRQLLGNIGRISPEQLTSN
jgi:hypothetical protein